MALRQPPPPGRRGMVQSGGISAPCKAPAERPPERQVQQMLSQRTTARHSEPVPRQLPTKMQLPRRKQGSSVSSVVHGNRSAASITPGHQLDGILVAELFLDDHALANLDAWSLRCPASGSVPDLHVPSLGEKRVSLQQRKCFAPDALGIRRARIPKLDIMQQRERRFLD